MTRHEQNVESKQIMVDQETIQTSHYLFWMTDFCVLINIQKYGKNQLKMNMQITVA